MDGAGSVLDVGCAVADFYFYLQASKKTVRSYTGFDLNPTFIARAKERLNGLPKTKALLSSIDDFQPSRETYDYTFVSGIMCHAASLEEALRWTRKLWQITRKKLVINFLSKPVGKGMRWFRPDAILTIQRQITPAFELAAHLPNDYTLILCRSFTHSRRCSQCRTYQEIAAFFGKHSYVCETCVQRQRDRIKKRKTPIYYKSGIR